MEFGRPRQVFWTERQTQKECRVTGGKGQADTETGNRRWVTCLVHLHRRLAGYPGPTQQGLDTARLGPAPQPLDQCQVDDLTWKLM